MMASCAPAFDLAGFWKENEVSSDKPFRTDKPRAPISLPLDDHWLLEEMAVPNSVRYFDDAEYRAQVNRACNDRCEEVLGRRFFSETVDLPRILRIEEVMGSERRLVEGGTPWLEPGVSTIEEMRDRLTEIERWSDRDLRDVIFSTGGQVTKTAPNSDGSTPQTITGSRGPATQATSILGTMNSLYWLIDYPVDMGRFFEVLGDIIIRYHNVLERETCVVYQGYYWLDDNCALYSPELYEEFCFPVVQQVLSAFAPGQNDYRYHHSDSEMRHLLPVMSRYNFKAVNLGPLIPASLIRQNMPHTVIHGEVAPNTLRDKGLEAIVAEVQRDFAAVGGDGGLVVTTCGSISAGTSLESIRGLMWAVQEYCRYE
jgi:uroporphyrinogen decarboxylase